jgi:hypothetical protein
MVVSCKGKPNWIDEIYTFGNDNICILVYGITCYMLLDYYTSVCLYVFTSSCMLDYSFSYMMTARRFVLGAGWIDLLR